MSTVEIQNVSKKYRLYNRKYTTLKEKMIHLFDNQYSDFWALRDISLTIPAGKSIGLVGKNGSGKSTLLKLITRIIEPTEGKLSISGKVSSLLELGAGFHPEFTGKENIFLNGAILGFTKKEIKEKIDEIIAFSELEAFIDNPVKTYSSGMYTRLGFSVATIMNPDIILIDEVLTVGDADFQKKCLIKLQEFRNANKTIIFVSHDMEIFKKICDEVVWLEKGHIKEIGSPEIVINKYLNISE